MTRDRSLDEFLGGVDEPRDEPDSEVVDDERESADVADDTESGDEEDGAVEPAVSTYEFSPDGAPCAACGAMVEKRWCDDGELVCPDCKQW